MAMYAQVIKGKAKDRAAVEAQAARWTDEVKPGAIGFVGGTAGVADDGTLLVVARFESEEAAQANSDRPEQGAWWSGMEPLLEDVTFRGSSDIETLFDGATSAATFVQIMEGTATDRAKAAAMQTPELEAQLRAARPDLLGVLRLWLDGGQYVEAAYFTNEADARSGETSGDFTGPQQDYAAVFGEPTFTDLRNPTHN
jgi:hypothetical protein